MLERKQKSLLRIKPKWDESIRVEEDELPNLKKTLHDRQVKIKAVQDELEEYSGTIAVLEHDYNVGNEITKDVTVYEQNEKEIKKYEMSIQELENKRNPEAKG